MQNLTPYEQETIINFNNAEKSAEVYTCDKRLMKKLSAFAEEFPEVYKLKSEDEYSKTYIISDKKYIHLRKPFSKPRTEKQIAAAKSNIARLNSMKKP